MNRSRVAFTLVELLVVISLIVLLVALLLPALGQAREMGRDVACRSQFKQIGGALTAFAVDHDQKLPGLWSAPWTDDAFMEWRGSIFGKELFVGNSWQPPPAAKPGVLVPYLGEDDGIRQLVRCPSLPFISFGSGKGSNGIFDIAMIQALPGARISGLPASANVIDPHTGQSIRTPLPVLVEEDPAYHINNSPCCKDFGHTSINRFGTWHLNSSGNYVSFDGSVQHLTFYEWPGPDCSSWSAQAPSGANVSLGIPRSYGDWNGL